MHRTLLAAGAGTLTIMASEPEWGPSRVNDCNRDCLVGFMDGYMNAIYQHDPKAVPPLAIESV